MEKNLPVYKLVVDENPESGYEVNYVALVESPAIERNFMAFSKQKPFFKFDADEDRRILTGPLMLSNIPIYRRTEEQGEFYVVFDAPTIYKIAQKFFQNGYQKNVNLMHKQDQTVDGAVMFESWIVDPTRGVAPMKGYEDAEPGSWFGSFYVQNDEVWSMVKSGEFLGFSVEGIFEMEPVVDPGDDVVQQLQKMMPEEIELIEAIKKLLA